MKDRILLSYMSTEELSKVSRRREFLGSGGFRAVHCKGSLQATDSQLTVGDCNIKLGIYLLVDGVRRAPLLLALLLVWVAAVAFVGTLAQQPYGDYNVQGYTCNGRDRTCSTYAVYRTFQEEDSLAIVAGYFNASVDDVSRLNNVTRNDSLSKGQALYIPITCTCSSTVDTSQMEVPHTIADFDTFMSLVSTIYGFLTTLEAMVLWNPTLSPNSLPVGYTMTVPIFCACPTVLQIDLGADFLITYIVASGDTDATISSFFGVTIDQIYSAQQFHSDLQENTTLLVPLSEPLPQISTMKSVPYGIRESSSSTRRRKVGIVSGLVAGAVAVLLALGFFIVRHQRTSSKRQHQGSLRDFGILNQSSVPRTFTFKELSKATKNFSTSQLLGSGGFGAVFKGTLPSGVLVAVKQMKMENKHGMESFHAEVSSLSHIRHRNLVELRGWCHDDIHLYLVYDYICNGNLDTLLFRTSEKIALEVVPLEVRRSILGGVAAALLYLHEECAQCVLHRDIKSSNVLLDGDLNAYLGDFGLARLMDHHKMGVTTMMAGTFGYMAPEMAVTCKATKESDVFSFGVLMLEVMCGARPLDRNAIDNGDMGVLVDKVWQAHEGGDILEAADSRLGSKCATMENKKMITNLLHLGLLCCHPNPKDRPSTRLVSQLLLLQDVEEMEAVMPPLPKCKPRAQFKVPGASHRLSGSVPSSVASSSAASLSGVPNGKPAQNILTTFVASSEFYSGR